MTIEPVSELGMFRRNDVITATIRGASEWFNWGVLGIGNCIRYGNSYFIHMVRNNPFLGRENWWKMIQVVKMYGILANESDKLSFLYCKFDIPPVICVMNIGQNGQFIIFNETRHGVQSIVFSGLIDWRFIVFFILITINTLPQTLWPGSRKKCACILLDPNAKLLRWGMWYYLMNMESFFYHYEVIIK